jgi:hypothetical protein
MAPHRRAPAQAQPPSVIGGWPTYDEVKMTPWMLAEPHFEAIMCEEEKQFAPRHRLR